MLTASLHRHGNCLNGGYAHRLWDAKALSGPPNTSASMTSRNGTERRANGRTARGSLRAGSLAHYSASLTLPPVATTIAKKRFRVRINFLSRCSAVRGERNEQFDFEWRHGGRSQGHDNERRGGEVCLRGGNGWQGLTVALPSYRVLRSSRNSQQAT